MVVERRGGCFFVLDPAMFFFLRLQSHMHPSLSLASFLLLIGAFQILVANLKTKCSYLPFMLPFICIFSVSARGLSSSACASLISRGLSIFHPIC